MDDDKHVVRHLRTDSSLTVQNWIFLRGIQSETKNLFFIFSGSLSFRYRKMRKLFFIGLCPKRGYTEKYFTPARRYPLIALPFYKDPTPAGEFIHLNTHISHLKSK